MPNSAFAPVFRFLQALGAAAVRTWSIKTRVMLAVALLLATAVVATSIVQMRFLRADFAKVLSDQQYATVQRMAREVDARFDAATRALTATAIGIEAAELAQPLELAKRLEGQAALAQLFDDLLVVSAEGRVIADYPRTPGRVGVDVSDRAYFRDVMASKATVISEPLLGKVRREPIVQVIAPILDPGKGVAGMLVGIIRLGGSSFIGALAGENAGDKGYYVLLTRGPNPVYVAHPERRRLLQPRPAGGSQPVSRAIEGFEGSSEGTSSSGVETLYSSRLLRTVPWVLIAASPSSEVFAPLQRAQRRLLLVSGGAALAVMPLAWASVWFLLAPLRRLRAAMVGLRNDASEFVPAVERADEVGEITTAFNRLMRQRLGAEKSQRDSEARMRLLADNMPALVSYLDAELRVQFANSCYRDWFRIEPDAMMGKRLSELFGAVSYEQNRPYLEAALEGYPATYEREIDTPTGPRTTRTVLFPHLDEESRVVGIYRMTTDISADRRLQRELDRQARRDELTGLHNRRSFEELLPQALARNQRSDRWLALLFIDLDRFKAVNDTLGHEAGDEVLRKIAERLSNCVRITDTVARLAGDEFTVILEGLVSPKDAEQVAAKVVERLQRPITTRAGDCSVGASVGIVACSYGSASPEDLMRRADTAAYIAKNAGRGRFHHAEPLEGVPGGVHKT